MRFLTHLGLRSAKELLKSRQGREALAEALRDPPYSAPARAHWLPEMLGWDE